MFPREVGVSFSFFVLSLSDFQNQNFSRLIKFSGKVFPFFSLMTSSVIDFIFAKRFAMEPCLATPCHAANTQPFPRTSG